MLRTLLLSGNGEGTGLPRGERFAGPLGSTGMTLSESFSCGPDTAGRQCASVPFWLLSANPIGVDSGPRSIAL